MFKTNEESNAITVHFQPPKPEIHILYKPVVGVEEAAYLADVSVTTFRADHMKDLRLLESSAYLEGNRWKFETKQLLEYIHLRACELRVSKGVFVAQ
ncbi:hypothetical protein [Listeria booriae]|uniref:hypothetical protein n=1 Tax=Listeria booriae TaxID=1552123 RepID=UPI00162A5F51|nr:hypothetical protein [Listeria booriae]MBC2106115.1 hypothetical protein [Listeria booriae]